jgi:hypothetical protein
VPRGIEVLIKKASVDPAFRKLLLEKRSAAAREIALELSPAEVAALNTVPLAQLKKVIANTTVPDPQRRAFLGQVGTLMLAALTVGLVGCERAPPATELWVEKGIRADLPPTPAASPAPVRPRTERLGGKVEGEGAGSVTVSVSYDCAFATGEITIEFLEARGFPGAAITDVQPVQPLAVSRGIGEAVFVARGSGGATNWLLVGLRATTAECRDPALLSPPSEFQPELYVEDDCAVWKVVEYHKQWSAQE